MLIEPEYSHSLYIPRYKDVKLLHNMRIILTMASLRHTATAIEYFTYHDNDHAMPFPKNIYSPHNVAIQFLKTPAIKSVNNDAIKYPNNTASCISAQIHEPTISMFL